MDNNVSVMDRPAAELAELIQSLWEVQETFDEKVNALRSERRSLMAAGAEPFTAYSWRDGKYLYRRDRRTGARRYVGSDPKKQQEVIDQVEKGNRVRQIDAELISLEDLARRLLAFYEQTGRQARYMVAGL